MMMMLLLLMTMKTLELQLRKTTTPPLLQETSVASEEPLVENVEAVARGA